jgi:two-component system, NtrC family, sensor kinase
VDSLKTKYPMRPDSSQVAGRVLLTKSVVRLEDALTDLDYDKRMLPRAMGIRRLLGVPMLREGEPLGVIVAAGELLMTFSTSEVAVCRSSDSDRSLVRWRSSLSSRVFSMAITAWSARVFSSSS